MLYLLFVNLHRILIPEWWLSNEKFVDKNAERPPVHCRAMTSVSDHFRSQILWCSAKCVSFTCGQPLALGRHCHSRTEEEHTVLDFFREAEVDKLKVTLGIYENILRFQVPIGHTLLFVEELEYEDNFRSIKLGR